MHKGPHISIAPSVVVSRILRIPPDDFAEWPASARETARAIAEELFLVAYNPFVDPETVRHSVSARLEGELLPLAHHYATSISEGVALFWSGHDEERRFRDELLLRLRAILPADAIVTRPGDLVACATDATDLRMELPLVVVEPDTPEAVSALAKLANELKFALIPRGGASGMTGGAVPARKRSVVLRVTRFTARCTVDTAAMTLTVDAGVITQNAIDEADRAGLLFTVDPASKTASTIGGNIAENSGGPFAFEYGTTLDNLLSWRMVTPTGELISIERVNHPRHKILPHEVAVFEVKDMSGGLRAAIELRGDEIRLPGLGKDVTDKALGGLPGMQKEGVDGVITDATFILHKKPVFTRVLVVECYGRSTHKAARLIGRLIGLRDHFRELGQAVRLSAMEEFNISYARAIGYKPKRVALPPAPQGADPELPVSVILIKAAGDDEAQLDHFVDALAAEVQPDDNAACIVAHNRQEGELFWEDRHRLSAIAKRTSGFKLNEDVVLPVEHMPDFALFLERLNTLHLSVTWCEALQEVSRLPGLLSHEGLRIEMAFADGLSRTPVDHEGGEPPIFDDELDARAVAFFGRLTSEFPAHAVRLAEILAGMHKNRVLVASHMHAGDGNCHVNIPVNSNNLSMVAQAEEAVAAVMRAAVAMGGAVSGEHGIGITKIAFLPTEKLNAIRLFKERVDPRDVFNPAKLTRRTLPVRPFTFSFNRLMADIREGDLPDKDALLAILGGVQDCTRCGKCRLVCPMMCPERSFHYAPRNKNMMLGALMEAIAYARLVTGEVPHDLLAALRYMTDHCTTCGRCTAVCPIGIPSAEVTLRVRAYLMSLGAGGSLLKTRILDWISHNPAQRAPSVIKMASFGQRMQNRVVNPSPVGYFLRRLSNPLLSHKGPTPNYSNLYNVLQLSRGCIFAAETPVQNVDPTDAVLYFPGCGGALVTRSIGLSVLSLLVRTGHTVIIPPEHLCCGYPMLTSGANAAHMHNAEHNRLVLQQLIERAAGLGFRMGRVITACGSCGEGLRISGLLDTTPREDAVQFALPRLSPSDRDGVNTTVLCHVSCHPEWSGLNAVKAIHTQTAALTEFCGVRTVISPHCCGESGMGAIAAPHVFNPIRLRKQGVLTDQARAYPDAPLLVGCPSCRMGLQRSLLQLKLEKSVLHTAEWLAGQVFGVQPELWGKEFGARISKAQDTDGIRRVKG